MPQLNLLSGRFHIVSYSRRYSFPTGNPGAALDHPAAFNEAVLGFLTRHSHP
ncbi:MAG TPA: hypothetical protein VGA56_06685 [Opitutaceae bacterium]